MYKKLLSAIITLLLTSTCYSIECEIEGKAILWAYDACLWQHETDDTLHPGVIKCVNKAEKLIKSFSDCEAKRIFKRKICDIAIQYKLNDINPNTCMSDKNVMGPSIRDGGI